MTRYITKAQVAASEPTQLSPFSQKIIEAWRIEKGMHRG